MKYCIRLDRPMPTWANGEQVLTGCEIYGVHHNCEGCPNLKEMGDSAFNANSIEAKDVIPDDVKWDADKWLEYTKAQKIKVKM